MLTDQPTWFKIAGAAIVYWKVFVPAIVILGLLITKLLHGTILVSEDEDDPSESTVRDTFFAWFWVTIALCLVALLWTVLIAILVLWIISWAFPLCRRSPVAQ